MQLKQPPGFDPELSTDGQVSRLGQPLCFNCAPSEDLAPWIARLYVAKVRSKSAPRVSCGILSDTANIRIQIEGSWTATNPAGPFVPSSPIMFLGPNSRRIAVEATTTFVATRLGFRPGACHALQGPVLRDMIDTGVPGEALGMDVPSILERFTPGAEPLEWTAVLEGIIRRRVEKFDGALPDPVTSQFELQCYEDPTITVAEAARRCGVERRRFERIIQRDFGMSPKQVLRRARALDMASHLRGVADRDEAESLMLRFYDQSHLIREFSALFGMSPSQFAQRPQPLMTLGLETRQSRRLESIQRLAPGEIKPWE